MIGLARARTTKALSGCIVRRSIVARRGGKKGKKKNTDSVWDNGTWDYETGTQTNRWKEECEIKCASSFEGSCQAKKIPGFSFHFNLFFVLV